MNLFNQSRLIKILQLIYKEDILLEEKIIHSLKISGRTLRTDIKYLNDELKEYDCKIVRVRKKGYRLENKKNVQQLVESLEDSGSEDDIKNRINIILSIIIMSKKFVSIDELMDKVFISRPTLSNYLTKIRSTLDNYSLKLQNKNNYGYIIDGSEDQKRKLIYCELIDRNFQDYVIRDGYFEKTFIGEVDHHLAVCIIDEQSIKNRVEFTDHGKKNFLILMAICIIRNHKGFFLENKKPKERENSDINQCLKEIFSIINTYKNYYLSSFDQSWILEEFFSENNFFYTSTDYKIRYSNIVDELLTFIDDKFQEDLSSDDVLRDGLIQHFSSFLPLIKSGNSIRNPMLGIVKGKYTYAYELALQSVSKNKLLSMYNFDENDVGYVAMHIAAAVERKYSKRDNLKVLIVNGFGKSLGTLIEASIKRKFLDKVRVVGIISLSEYRLNKWENVDLIISTVPISGPEKNIIDVQLNSIGKDLEKIQNYIENYDTSKKIKELFSERLFIINEEKSNRNSILDELIVLMSKDSQNNSLLKEEFLKRENLAATNITEYIAIPHIITQTRETKVAICVSKEKISWSTDSTVQIIFLIMVNQKDIKKLELFFELLSELVEDDNHQKELTKIVDYNGFVDYLAKWLKLE